MEHSVSELQWLRVHAYLQQYRFELAVRAADRYPKESRVAGTPLLAAPSWLPEEPVPLRDIRLTLRPEAPPPGITGTDVTTVAPDLLPERPDGSPYLRHSDVIGALAAPAIFENRPTYQLTSVDLTGDQPHLDFTLGRFFDGVDVGGAAGHEYAAAEMGVIGEQGLRDAIKDPCDLAAHPHAMAVGALTLRYDRATGTAEFPLHWRDPKRVGHAGGMFQVIPVGIFQPSGEAEWNVANDFDLWRGLLREFAEELLGVDEDHGSETAPIDYDAWPFGRRMTAALDSGDLDSGDLHSGAPEDGRIRAWCLGLGTDPLTFAMDLLTVVVIDAPLYDDLFAAAVSDNAEGEVLPLRPFTAESVAGLVGNHPVQAAGAALLTLALQHRATLLA
jgi:hypothetical protein